MPPEELNAVVVQRIEVSPGLIILRVIPDGWKLPEFEPGQYGVLGLEPSAPRTRVSDREEDPPDPSRLIKRAYSIASSSKAREYVEFYISLVPSGRLTPRLFHLQPADRLWLSPRVKGLFTLKQVPEDRHVVFISTGTGLAPYMSMLRTELTCGAPHRFAVLHGARHSWDLGYRSELHTLRNLCSNFTYLPIISRPDEEATTWPGKTGYVQNLWRDGALAEVWGFSPTPEDTHVFLCGNPAMIEAAVVLLESDGFTEHRRHQPGQVHVERYW